MQPNNNDKAKKILFGRTDIGDGIKFEGYDENGYTKVSTPQSQWHDPEMTGPIGSENRIKKFSMYEPQPPSITSDHTILPPIDTSMDEKCACGGVYQKTTDPAAFVCSKCNTTKIIHPSMDIQNDDQDTPMVKRKVMGEPITTYAMYGDMTNKSKMEDVLDQVQRVYDYCQQNNITAEELINQHKYLRAHFRELVDKHFPKE